MKIEEMQDWLSLYTRIWEGWRKDQEINNVVEA